PNLLSSRLNANENAAIATLKNIATSQAQCRTSGAIDTNANGAGEYGYLAELSGGVGIRTSAGSPSATLLSPPALSGAFAEVHSPAGVTGGVVARSGYYFQLYLPDGTGAGIPEADTGGVSTAPDANRAEVMWCCYAWPLAFGSSGRRAFFTNHGGDILGTPNHQRRYSGGVSVPTYDAAYLKGSGRRMASTIAANTSGQDDQVWIVLTK
ncbi:MAG: hypothetical protein KDC87_11685, partial [Planctomycetes bacterium]|nr:hypothetical protein [Planctomycetota bacterium]